MKHILLLEPDTTLANTIAEYLGQVSQAVAVVNDAQEAIFKADTTKPDVVVLELAIPSHNGIAFLQEFRSYVDWVAVPIIIYSHIPQSDTGLSAADWEKYGVVEYLYKPIAGLRDLQKSIDTVESVS